MKYITLKFFETNIRLYSDNRALIDRVKYIFRYYVVFEDSYDVLFVANINNELSDDKYKDFSELGLLTSTSALNVKYSYDGKNYKEWLYEDTFFPPLQIKPLAGRFLVLHGCAVRKNGLTIVFLAPSLAGKTSLTLYLLGKGYKCLSDDLIFINENNIIPYKKPVGIRETGLDIIPNLRELTMNNINKETLTFLNPKGKKTWLMHLDDLFDNPYYNKPTQIDYIVFPDKYLEGKYKTIGNYDLFSKILKSVCNSGIYKEEVSLRILKLISSLKGAYILPTLDIELASDEIESIIKNKGGRARELSC